MIQNNPTSFSWMIQTKEMFTSFRLEIDSLPSCGTGTYRRRVRENHLRYQQISCRLSNPCIPEIILCQRSTRGRTERSVQMKNKEIRIDWAKHLTLFSWASVPDPWATHLKDVCYRLTDTGNEVSVVGGAFGGHAPSVFLWWLQCCVPVVRWLMLCDRRGLNLWAKNIESLRAANKQTNKLKPWAAEV